MKKTDQTLSPQLLQARAEYLDRRQAQTDLQVELTTLRDRLAKFESDIKDITDRIQSLRNTRQALEIEVGLGKSTMEQVQEVINQQGEQTELLESLKNVAASITSAIKAKDEEGDRVRALASRDREYFLKKIAEQGVKDILPGLRLIFAAHIKARGGNSNFDALMRDFVQAANIRDLADQEAILAERFGFTG